MRGKSEKQVCGCWIKKQIERFPFLLSICSCNCRSSCETMRDVASPVRQWETSMWQIVQSTEDTGTPLYCKYSNHSLVSLVWKQNKENLWMKYGKTLIETNVEKVEISQPPSSCAHEWIENLKVKQTSCYSSIIKIEKFPDRTFRQRLRIWGVDLYRKTNDSRLGFFVFVQSQRLMKNKIMVNKIQDGAKLNLTSFTMCLYKCLCIIDILKFM